MDEPEVGIQLPTIDPSRNSAQDLKAAAMLAEELGFDSVWVGDHLTFNAPVVEAFVAATLAATVTSRIQVGFGVLVAALRSPAWLAKQISSLQVVSGGRVDLGIGIEVLVHPASDPGIAEPEMESYMNHVYNVPFDHLRPFTMHGEEGIINGVEKLWRAGATKFALLPASHDFQSTAPQLAAIAEHIRQLGSAKPIASSGNFRTGANR